MGFLKSITKALTKPLVSITPKPLKKILSKADSATGDLLFGGAYTPEQAAPAPVVEAAPVDTAGRLTQTEIDANLEQSKKMARLGKYFTSPLGALSQASTAGQKVFS